MENKTITRSELRQKSFCNSPSLDKIIIDGQLYEWVGIGWVELHKATDEEIKTYPTVIE